MKASIKIFLGIVFLMTLVVHTATAQKQPSAKAIAVKNAVDSQRYIFHAENVLPLRGSQRFLTSGYDVTVTKDSVISYLPYFGRAYSAPLNNEGGIQFTSTNFTYAATTRKKGGWEITISTKDAGDVRQLLLTIFENGTASLNVTSNNRDPISFSGTVTKIKSK